MEQEEIFRRLRNLVGKTCEHLGERCTVLDLMWSEGILVLRVESSPPLVQSDQYGRASIRTQALREIPLFGTNTGSYSGDLIEILATVDNPRPPSYESSV